MDAKRTDELISHVKASDHTSFSKPMSVYLNSLHMSMFMLCVFGHRFLLRLL